MDTYKKQFLDDTWCRGDAGSCGNTDAPTQQPPAPSILRRRQRLDPVVYQPRFRDDTKGPV